MAFKCDSSILWVLFALYLYGGDAHVSAGALRGQNESDPLD